MQLQPSEQVVAGRRIRNESGSRAKDGGKSSGLYKRWSRAHHAKVLPVGLPEDDHAPHVNGLGDRSALLMLLIYKALWPVSNILFMFAGANAEP